VAHNPSRPQTLILTGGISKFLSKQIHVGVVGYAYQQLTGDSGSGATFRDSNRES
jgi:hypothetical protein